MKTYYFLPFSLPSPWSFALLSSRNSATMVTWRHTSPLYSVWKLINLFVNDTITAFCRTICLPSFISNVTNYKDKLWKTARLTSKFKNHDCNLCFSSFQVCHSVSPFVFVLYLFFVLIISAVVFISQSLCGSSRCLWVALGKSFHLCRLKNHKNSKPQPEKKTFSPTEEGRISGS